MCKQLIKSLSNKTLYLLLVVAHSAPPFFSQSTKFLDSIISITQKSEIDSVSINAYNKWGQFIFKDNVDSAFNIYQRGIEIAKHHLSREKLWKPGEKRGVEISLGMLIDELGYYHSKKGNINSAITHYFESLKLFEKNRYFKGIANELNNIGFIYFSNLNDSEKAKEKFNLAEKIFKALKDSSNQANALHNLASVYDRSKEYDKAIELFAYSIDIRTKIKEYEKLSMSYNYLAFVHYKIKNYNLAKEYLLKSIALTKKHENKMAFTNALAMLGNVYLIENDIDKALNYGLEAYRTANDLKFPFFIQSSSKLLYAIYKKQGKWKEAYEMYALAELIEDSTQNNTIKNNILREEIRYRFEKKSIEDSINFETAKLQKDFIIQQQADKISNAKNNRNSIVAILSLSLFTGLLLLNRRRLYIRLKANRIILDNLSIEQKLLRVQMNPHFIFNALNSIQSFIIEKESEIAKAYLLKFSQLLRSIIEQSEKNFISIKEEVETLSLYLEMEKLRFGNKFNCEILINDKQNIEKFKIPPLIIQPFLENSIVHGVSNKPEQGNIKIEISSINDTVRCIIEDDGIGRESAEKINEKRKKTNSSLATVLVKERLEKIQVKNKCGNIKIVDLFDKESIACGTRIEIEIPILN